MQPVIALSKNWKLGLRVEYFVDKEGARTGINDLNAFNLTFTPTLKLDPVTFRFEYRFDNSNKKIFIEKEKIATDKNSNTISLEVSCNF